MMNSSTNSSFSPFADYAGPPPVLIAATSDQARARASLTIEAAGYRVAAVDIAEAVDRLSVQASASALWVELDADPGAPLDRLLDRVEAEAGSGRFPAIVAAPASLIDPIVAHVRDPSVELLFDATLAERAATLALATARGRAEPRLNDIAVEPSAARLRQLSDEISRIAASLARLSVGPGAPAANRNEPASTGGVPRLPLKPSAR